MGRLDGKVALITGAGSGIGQAGAELFAAEGARVVVVDVSEDNARAVVDGIVAAGGQAIARVANVADVDQVRDVVDDSISTYGQLDIVWGNAGIARGTFTPIEEFKLEEWHEVMNINLNGFFYLVRAAIPHMKQRQQGLILSTASIAGIVAHAPGRAPYSASKGALIALTRLLAMELSGHNIRVNTIAPGTVKTRLRDNDPPVPEVSPFGMVWNNRMVPSPVTDATRPATPEEIAHTALYLADDRVGPVNGAVLVVDGGRSTR